MEQLLIVLALLQLKHLFFDWLYQPKWMWANKHIYGHYGGIAHAGLNALGTAYVVSVFYGYFWLVLTIDFLLHYHIDWAKMRLNEDGGLKPDNPDFWGLLGADQALHQLTYLIILANVIEIS